MIHILYGNNPYEIIQAKQELLAKSQLDPETIEALDHTLLSFQQKLCATDLFSSQNLFVVEGLSLQKNWNIEALSWLEKLDESLIDVIVCEPSIDLRSSFARNLKKNKNAQEFRQLDDRTLVSWAIERAKKKEFKIDVVSTQHLVDRVGNDQWRLDNELDKLCLLNQKIDKNVIDQHTTPMLQTTIFHFLDALFAARDSTDNRLQDLIDSGANHIYIITMLGWSLQNYLALHYRKDYNLRELAELTQIKEGVLSRSARSRELSGSQVKLLIAATLQADIDAKTRKIVPDTHLRQLLAQYEEILQ
jgi:DNA polymerase III delta subunit